MTSYISKNKSSFLTLLLCFLVGVFFIYFFSYSTSPRYPDFFGGDSAHFMTVGMSWLHGKLPYIDLFDHKGPLIYFINMLGFAIAQNTKFGIVIIQFVFMCFTITAIYELSQQARNDARFGFLIVIIALIALTNNYFEGNLVEEYCLPFLCWSAYGLLKWYKGNRKDHDYRWAFFYGITLGICLLTRVTNFAPLGGGILVICIYLLVKGYVKNLFQNAGAFLAGFFITISPFVVYFAIRGGLTQMFYDVLLFNIQYAKGCPAWIENADITTCKVFFFKYIYFISIFPLIIIRLIKKDYLSGAAFFITALVETKLYTNGFSFIQYPLVCLVQITQLIIETFVLLTESRRWQKIIPAVLLTGLAVLLVRSAGLEVKKTEYIFERYHTVHQRDWQPLLIHIPSDERDSFVGYGGDEFKELYPISGLLPCYKYYVIQDWIYGFDENIQAEMDSLFEGRTAKWILKDKYYSRYNDILSDSYFIYDRAAHFKLYRKVDDNPRYLSYRDIQNEADINSYLRKLQNMQDVVAIFTIKDIQGYYLTEDIISLLESCGLTDMSYLLDHHPKYLIGITANGNELLHLSGDKGSETASIAFKGHSIEMASANNDCGNIASVCIDNVERAVNKRGLNIVLMDMKTGAVFDSVSFDTHVPEMVCSRTD